MINYYEILGLSAGAGGLEIKNAFRRLAMLYHPDKNPNGIEQFNRILKAYEILSDPVKKSNYDYKLRHQTSATQDFETKNTGTKNWRFDEKELKRRQYYNDFIKKESKEAESFDAFAQEKRTYSDYKYIFFATPLAVVLFLLIMKLATPYKTMPTATASHNTPATPIDASPVLPKTGAEFYNNYYGTQQYDSLQQSQINIINETPADAVVTLLSQGKFLRSVFVKSEEAFAVQYLPRKIIDITYCSGLNFVPQKDPTNANQAGPFLKQQHFYKKLEPVKFNAPVKLSLKSNHTGFVEISREEFFKK